MGRAKKKGRGNTLSKKLAVTREEETKAAELARDVRTLCDWMRNDILSLAGPETPARRELFDFVALRGTQPQLFGAAFALILQRPAVLRAVFHDFSEISLFFLPRGDIL